LQRLGESEAKSGVALRRQDRVGWKRKKAAVNQIHRRFFAI
jgi:hypothetical protein